MLARRRIAAVLVVVFGLFVAACGSSNNSSSSGGGGGGASTGEKISGAKVIDANSLNNPPKGTVKYCQGKDTTGSAKALIKDFNAKYSAQGYKATLTEFPASADQQRTQFIQRQQAKSDDCDVFSSDVIWTAEFASQKWLYDLTPYIERPEVEVHRRAPRDRALRRLVLGRPGDQRRGVHLLPDRQGLRQAARDVAAGLCGRQGAGWTRLPGRAVRGPDLRLPRAGLRGRRHGALTGRQEVDDQLAGEHQGAAAHGRRHQGRLGPQGGHDLHGARDRPGVDQRQVRLHAQLDLRLRRGQQERRARSRASTRSPRCRPSRAPARPASSAATTASSASTRRTRASR